MPLLCAKPCQRSADIKIVRYGQCRGRKTKGIKLTSTPPSHFTSWEKGYEVPCHLSCPVTDVYRHTHHQSQRHVPWNPIKDTLLEREGAINFLPSFLISESLFSWRQKLSPGQEWPNFKNCLWYRTLLENSEIWNTFYRLVPLSPYGYLPSQSSPVKWVYSNQMEVPFLQWVSFAQKRTGT